LRKTTAFLIFAMSTHIAGCVSVLLRLLWSQWQGKQTSTNNRSHHIGQRTYDTCPFQHLR